MVLLYNWMGGGPLRLGLPDMANIAAPPAIQWRLQSRAPRMRPDILA